MSAFVLNKKYELALPTSYVDVDNEEMEYVDGGAWNTYRGYSALNELTNMIAACSSWVGVTVGLVKACAASASTGVGLVIAVGAAVGAMITWTFAMLNMGLAVAAANFYKSYNGFKVNSTCCLGYTQYWGVKKI